MEQHAQKPHTREYLQGFKYPNYIFEGSEHVHRSEITFQNYTGSVLDPLFRVRWEGLGTRLVIAYHS